MSGDRQNDDIDLHAYLDGALDSVRRDEIEARLETDQAWALKLAKLQADKTMLRQVYGPLRDRPLPQEWLSLLKASKPRSQLSWRLIGAIAAVILVVALAGVYSYRWIQPRTSGEIVATALDARNATNGGTQRPATDAEARGFDATVSNVVGTRVRVPDMRRLGYRLTGIQLYGGPVSNSAAELLYRDDAGRLFTLYLRRSDGRVRFDQFRRANLRICVWQDDQVGMVMAGDVSAAAMQRLASLAYTGLAT
jgi:anti-sigma factor RsiW